MADFTIEKVKDGSRAQDELRIKASAVEIELNVFSGKQGDTFIYYAPAIEVSGYGKTEEEAIELFEISVRAFCEDIVDMKVNERTVYLQSLGFSQQRFKRKNFSKVYVDEDGVLQRFFDEGTVERKVLEYA